MDMGVKSDGIGVSGGVVDGDKKARKMDSEGSYSLVAGVDGEVVGDGDSKSEVPRQRSRA